MPQDISANNRLIAKNTVALYFRTFITMIVGLYTGRVMLQALGIDNYGINNVVGGIVGFSSLITGTMSQAISRYLTYSLGSSDTAQLHKMFSTAVNAQIVISLIAVAALEIVGIWFLRNEANIPDGRMEAAHWVFQCALVSLVIGLVSSSYNAMLVAHEHMGIYAYTSIAESALKLLVCFVVIAYGGDRLVFFAMLNVGVCFGMFAFYRWYCGKHFEEAHYNPRVFDKHLLKELSVFSGWNLMNHTAYVFATQGVNMLINVFFGVVFNAARGVAMTVNGVVQSFVGNFTVAFTPQITKSYAAGDKSRSVRLGNVGTRLTWLMMYLFIVPICMEADTLLSLWLVEVPAMSPLFLRLVMFESLAVASGQNLYRLIQADGNISHYVMRSCLVAGLIFPVIWVAYRLGAPVWVSYLVFIVDYLFLNLLRFYEIKRLMPFSVRQHLRECVMPCSIVSVASFVLPLAIAAVWDDSLLRFFVMVPVSVLWTGGCCMLFGLTKRERMFVIEKAQAVARRVIRR